MKTPEEIMQEIANEKMAQDWSELMEREIPERQVLLTKKAMLLYVIEELKEMVKHN